MVHFKTSHTMTNEGVKVTETSPVQSNFYSMFTSFKIFLFKKFFQNTIRVSNSWDPDHDRRSVGADLGPKVMSRGLARKELRQAPR